MAVIERFLGKRVEIPESLRYDVKQGLWAEMMDEKRIRFGLAQPEVVLLGGIKDLEWLADPKSMVRAGDTVLFAITGKILYLEAPVGGLIAFNQKAKESPGLIADSPYADGWLFEIAAGAKDYASLSGWKDYLKRLQKSDGFKNPEGIKGGVSGICKAVYTGIGAQRFQKGEQF